jgi:hypothetical protein
VSAVAPVRPVAELATARIVADKAVVGLASGYTEAQLAPFLVSLRQTGYDGAVVLLVDDHTIAATRGAAVLDDVQLVRIRALRSPAQPALRKLARSSALWPLLGVGGWVAVRLAGLGRPSPERDVRQRAIAGRALHPALARNFFYWQLLENSDVGQVLLTDTRDVLFQADPFECLAGAELWSGLESDTLTIGGEFYNRVGTRVGFGRAMLKRIGDRQVSCAGIIGGSGAAIKEYIRHMTDGLLDMPPQGVVFTTDQALHNVLIWTNVLPVELSQALGSPIATLNLVSMDDLHFDARGRLVTPDGTLIGIVHQYDRVDGLSERLWSALELNLN